MRRGGSRRVIIFAALRSLTNDHSRIGTGRSLLFGGRVSFLIVSRDRFNTHTGVCDRTVRGVARSASFRRLSRGSVSRIVSTMGDLGSGIGLRLSNAPCHVLLDKRFSRRSVINGIRFASVLRRGGG